VNNEAAHPEALLTTAEQHTLRARIDAWASALGFAAVAVSDRKLEPHWQHLQRWLSAGHHGGMEYMQRHAALRRDPAALVPGTVTVLSLRMDYLPAGTAPLDTLADPGRAYISRYALGRDYHKLMRRRLADLAQHIRAATGPGSFRAIVDSAPALERALAERAGLGWIAKNTMLINAEAGSWFFLGEIFTDLPLTPDAPQSTQHCGSCDACLRICPTDAFVGPHQLDARRCISYLTIEHDGSIDPELRPLMGNRVFGCDDCQLICPWNKFAQFSKEPDFQPRHGLDSAQLLDLFQWTEAQFMERTAGSPIRRIGHERWQRNLAIGLGNAPADAAIICALEGQSQNGSAMVREHVQWALQRQRAATPAPAAPILIARSTAIADRRSR